MDKIKILAGSVLIGAILLFYANIFSPRWIPPFLRFGIPSHPLHVLLIGSDFTYDSMSHRVLQEVRGRSDTLMLLQLHPLEGRVDALSIPRDTLVTVPAHGERKINAAFSMGGLELCKKTVEGLTGVTVHHVVVVNPKGLAHLVDALGGMWINVEKDMVYVDHWGHLNINLKKGWQKLSGEALQGYLRYRQDSKGDLSRIERQQHFIPILAKNIANPLLFWRAPLLIKTLRATVYTNFSPTQLLQVANFLRYVSPSDFHFHTVPGHTMIGLGGASLYGADRGELEKLLEENFDQKESNI